MNLKLNENRKVIYKYLEKDYLIIWAENAGYFIDIKSEDGIVFSIEYNQENIKVLKESIPEVFI